MSEELKYYCEKFQFEKGFIKLLKDVEMSYSNVSMSQDYSEGVDMTMCEWIFTNTKIEEFNELSDRDKFFLGFGVLIAELNNI